MSSADSSGQHIQRWLLEQVAEQEEQHIEQLAEQVAEEQGVLLPLEDLEEEHLEEENLEDLEEEQRQALSEEQLEAWLQQEQEQERFEQEQAQWRINQQLHGDGMDSALVMDGDGFRLVPCYLCEAVVRMSVASMPPNPSEPGLMPACLCCNCNFAMEHVRQELWPGATIADAIESVEAIRGRVAQIGHHQKFESF